MMSIKIEKDDVKELACSGSMFDLLAEVGFAVRLITLTCPACGSERVFWNKRDILECESCGWRDKETT